MKAKWERDRQRRVVVQEYEGRRKALKGLIKNEIISEEVRICAKEELEKLPRDSSAVRVRNRCVVSGRGRGVYRKLKVSRIVLRKMGLEKASW
jgi:small subunit ribosomal protein S14